MKKRVFLKPVGVVFDQDTYDLLVKITTREQLSKSEFIRNVVREAMDKYQIREERKNAK
jgi:metal-responsive CopG/Arc/MetJ family transcriptional regulator